MIKKFKLMIVIGTRPEIIRLASVIKECDKHFNTVLVHTGQNYDYQLNEIFFDDLKLRKPDHFLNVAGKNLGATLGAIIESSYEVMIKEKPDALLVLGDTNSALSVLPAKRLKIPIFHMEAGNRCFDQNVPEEINRKLVDHISDEHSRKYLLSEGIRKEFIFVTGSPMPEVLAEFSNEIKNSKVLEKLNLKKEQYIVVSAHREENLDNDVKFQKLVDALNLVAEEYKMPVIYSTHPRSMKKIEEKKIKFNPLIQNILPLGLFDYNHLQKNSFCVLSDSGTLSEESAILGFPGVLIRTSTERPEVLDSGNIVISGVEPVSVLNSISVARSLFSPEARVPVDYEDKNVSKKVVRIISSYINIVRDRVWQLPPVQ